MFSQGMFQTDPGGMTPQEVARRRAVAEALMAGVGSASNMGEGIVDLIRGIVAGVQNRGAAKAEASGKASAGKAFSALFGSPGDGGFGDAGKTADAVKPYGSTEGTGDKGPPMPWEGAKSFAAAKEGKGSNGVRKALLDAISGTESAGRYDVIYGGSRFKDYSDHPRKAVPIKSGPNAGKTSSAAGRYQFLGKTWDSYRDKLGLSDFSPDSQDKAAWALASDVYRQKTGHDLDAALASGDPATIANVGKALSGTWTSLPGGIEQGIGSSKFVNAYQKALNASPAAEAIERIAPVSVASIDPSAWTLDPVPDPTSRPNVEQQMPIPSPRPDFQQPMPSPVSIQPQAVSPQDMRSRLMMLAGHERQTMGSTPSESIGTPPDARMPFSGMGGGSPFAPSAHRAVPAASASGGSAQPMQVAQAQGMIESDGLPPMQILVEAVSNPWLNEHQRDIASQMLQRKMNPPAPKYEEVGGRIVRINPDGTITEAYDPGMSPADQARVDLDRQKFEFERNKPVTVGGDARLAGPDGRVLLDAVPKQPSPTNDEREYERAVQQGYAGSFVDYQKEMRRAGATNINTGGGTDKQVFDAMAESALAARSAVTGLNAVQQARRAVADGGIFGAGADVRLGLQKIGAFLGVADAQAIVNTETFRSAIAPQVAALMKATVGSTQISNADREFAEKAAGGSINLDPGTIGRLLDIMERASNAVIAGHAARLDAIYPDTPEFARERALFGIPAAAPQDVPSAVPQGVQPRRLKFNPATGELE